MAHGLRVHSALKESAPRSGPCTRQSKVPFWLPWTLRSFFKAAVLNLLLPLMSPFGKFLSQKYLHYCS